MNDRDILWRKELEANEFDISSVWTWDAEHDGFYPVFDPIPSMYMYDDLFVKAVFQTPDGQLFNGYLVGGGFYHAFFILIDERDFGFNINLRPLIMQEQERLWQYLGVDPFPLFPLSYKSDVILKETGPVEGVLDWGA